jgi:hypothetical protein
VIGASRGLKIVTIAMMNPTIPPTRIAGVRIAVLPLMYSRQVNAAEKVASSTSRNDFVVVP